MNLDHAKEHLEQIIRSEFDKRDIELEMGITVVKQKMNRYKCLAYRPVFVKSD